MSVPMCYCTFTKLVTRSDFTDQTLHEILSKHHNNKTLLFVKFMSRVTGTGCDPSEHLFRNNILRPDAFVNTNKIELLFFNNNDDEMVVLCAVLDNLGKVSSGAAV